MPDFVRYFNLIKSKAKKAILQVDKKLVHLLKECNFDNYIFSNDEKLPEFDIHCPLLSLPLKFSTTLPSIPIKNKYLVENRFLFKLDMFPTMFGKCQKNVKYNEKRCL